MNFITIFWILSFVVRSLCLLLNVSIDDTFGDERNSSNMITYSDLWQFGQSCVTCGAKLDPNQTFERTWHDRTFYPIGDGRLGNGELVWASASFNGTKLNLRHPVDTSLTSSTFRYCSLRDGYCHTFERKSEWEYRHGVPGRRHTSGIAPTTANGR